MTESRQSFQEKGISPVIGVVLLVAIVVAIAGVVGFFVINLNNTQNNAQAGTQIKQTEAGVQVRLVDPETLRKSKFE